MLAFTDNNIKRVNITFYFQSGTYTQAAVENTSNWTNSPVITCVGAANKACKLVIDQMWTFADGGGVLHPVQVRAVFGANGINYVPNSNPSQTLGFISKIDKQ